MGPQRPVREIERELRYSENGPTYQGSSHWDMVQPIIVISCYQEYDDLIHGGINMEIFIYNKVNFIGSGVDDKMIQTLGHIWDY